MSERVSTIKRNKYNYIIAPVKLLNIKIMNAAK